MLRVTDPDFAPTDETGWVLDRTFGVDDLLPPPAGGPGPVTFDHPYVPNGSSVPPLPEASEGRNLGTATFSTRCATRN
jgi:hypothetical protein